jgi:uncharacterized protein
MLDIPMLRQYNISCIWQKLSAWEALQMLKSKIITRYFIFIVGIFFMGLGVSLTTKSGLGTSPISSVPYVLSLIFPITIGQFTFWLSLLFLLTEIIILRKEFPKEQFLQVLVGPFFGLFVDLGMFIFAYVSPKSYASEIIVLILGCIILSLGIYMQVAANVIVNPGEGVVKVIANKTKIKFGNIKIIFDSTLVAAAAIISIFAFGRIKGIREGTIICAILVGNFTKVYSAIFEHFKYKKAAYAD